MTASGGSPRAILNVTSEQGTQAVAKATVDPARTFGSDSYSGQPARILLPDFAPAAGVARAVERALSELCAYCKPRAGGLAFVQFQYST